MVLISFGGIGLRPEYVGVILLRRWVDCRFQLERLADDLKMGLRFI